MNSLIHNKWKILILLFLANTMNFFDRTIPAVVIESIRLEYSLNDKQLGMLAAAFSLVYAIAGLYFGKLADRNSRKKIIGIGLIAWSGFTAMNALAWSYIFFFMARVGVGVGEASYAPAANSLIGDLFPPQHRAKAIGIFMLGLPVGMVLAFFTVGGIAQAFNSWRAPFIVAAVPGLILAICFFFIREPARGAAEVENYQAKPSKQNSLGSLLKIKTLRWIILSGIMQNLAIAAGIAFLVPLFLRYFGLTLIQGSLLAGCIIGITGLIGLTLGGVIADKIYQKSKKGRLLFGALCLLISAIMIGLSLMLKSQAVVLFTVLSCLGWLAMYNYYTTVYPAIQEVVEPNQRAMAFGLCLAIMYVLGGAFGPLLVGALSDHYANAAMTVSGATGITDQFRAIGLHKAMIIIPITLLLSAVFIYMSAQTFMKDALTLRQPNES